MIYYWTLFGNYWQTMIGCTWFRYESWLIVSIWAKNIQISHGLFSFWCKINFEVWHSKIFSLISKLTLKVVYVLLKLIDIFTGRIWWWCHLTTYYRIIRIFSFLLLIIFWIIFIIKCIIETRILILLLYLFWGLSKTIYIIRLFFFLELSLLQNRLAICLIKIDAKSVLFNNKSSSSIESN